MNQFSEAWLREYQSKRAAVPVRPPAFMPIAEIRAPAPPMPGAIAFTLPKPTILLNVLIRMSWLERHRYQRNLSADIAALVPHDPNRGPLEMARVTVRRFSIGEPDADALGGVKMLVDTLLVRSKTHPDGLGFCVDDGPAHMELIVEAVRVGKRKDQRTEVRVEAL